MSTNAEKTYVQADAHASIVCPDCGFVKLVSVKGLKHPTRPVHIACRCGCRFKRLLEYRKTYRKDTDLSGTVRFLAEEDFSAAVQLVNLSMGGACLRVNNIAFFATGDQGDLHFTLDNLKNSTVSRQIIIRSFSMDRMHCEFINNKAYDKDLGFYLRI